VAASPDLTHLHLAQPSPTVRSATSGRWPSGPWRRYGLAQVEIENDGQQALAPDQLGQSPIRGRVDAVWRGGVADVDHGCLLKVRIQMGKRLSDESRHDDDSISWLSTPGLSLVVVSY
jgi:hypothetical protein